MDIEVCLEIFYSQSLKLFSATYFLKFLPSYFSSCKVAARRKPVLGKSLRLRINMLFNPLQVQLMCECVFVIVRRDKAHLLV